MISARQRTVYPFMLSRLPFYSFVCCVFSHVCRRRNPLPGPKHRFSGSPMLGLGAARTQLRFFGCSTTIVLDCFHARLAQHLSFIHFDSFTHFISLCIIHFECIHSLIHSFIHFRMLDLGLILFVDWFVAPVGAVRSRTWSTGQPAVERSHAVPAFIAFVACHDWLVDWLWLIHFSRFNHSHAIHRDSFVHSSLIELFEINHFNLSSFISFNHSHLLIHECFYWLIG